MAGRPKSRAKRSRALTAAPSPDALERFKKAGVECGFDARAMERFLARLQGSSLSTGGRLKLDDKELLALVDDGIARAFQVLDDFALGEASARDVATIIGILTDKRQILKGEPTAILRYEDMRKLDEFLEDVSKELKRRGEGPDVIDVTPNPAATPVENPGNGNAP